MHAHFCLRNFTKELVVTLTQRCVLLLLLVLLGTYKYCPLICIQEKNWQACLQIMYTPSVNVCHLQQPMGVEEGSRRCCYGCSDYLHTSGADFSGSSSVLIFQVISILICS